MTLNDIKQSYSAYFVQYFIQICRMESRLILGITGHRHSIDIYGVLVYEQSIRKKGANRNGLAATISIHVRVHPASSQYCQSILFIWLNELCYFENKCACTFLLFVNKKKTSGVEWSFPFTVLPKPKGWSSMSSSMADLRCCLMVRRQTVWFYVLEMQIHTSDT